MSHVLNHDFRFFAYRNIAEFCRSIHFCFGYSDILNKLAPIVFSLYFKNQTLELLQYLSFKPELPTNDLQDISFLDLKSILR